MTIPSLIYHSSGTAISSTDAPVTWSVSNPEVISIDPSSGIGIAKAAGTAVVYYGVGDLLTHVQVDNHFVNIDEILNKQRYTRLL